MGVVARITTFAFDGVEAQPIDVEVQLSGGQIAFMVVGLPDKAVGESRERVRAAFAALGLALPPKRVIVNLAPADLPKEGSHHVAEALNYRFRPASGVALPSGSVIAR